MPRKQRPRAAVELPKGVHKVRAGSKEYYYFQIGRGTKSPGPRIRLSDDPRSPEFWQALREAQGKSVEPPDTVSETIDAYLAETAKTVEASTFYHYRRSLAIAKVAWGPHPARAVRPIHVDTVMKGLSDKPSKANHFLACMKSYSAWCRARDIIDQSMVEGVKPFKLTGGHKPWTDEQVSVALSMLKGTVRQGFVLYLYTGQRGSDIVRLGPTHVDDGGFLLSQKKTGVEVWCPILPELAAEMVIWPKQPGPYLRQANGENYDRRLFWKHFTEAIEDEKKLKGVTLHGLRATAVVRLRRAGLSTLQIGDIVGMSPATIARYCRFADKKLNGKAALIAISGHRKKNVQ